ADSCRRQFRALRRPRARARRSRRERPPGRRGPPEPGLRQLRPVRELRGARRRVPPARRGAHVRSAGQLDHKLLALLTLGLVAFGLVMVYSATSASAALGNSDPMAYLERQALYALIGIVVMVVASRFDYHRLRYLAPGLLLAALALCTAVLV